MAKRDDGGPAFPAPSVAGGDGTIVETGEYGMSLRDYLAGQALAGAAGARVFGEHSEVSADARHRAWLHLAAECYCMADAMIAVRAPAAKGRACVLCGESMGGEKGDAHAACHDQAQFLADQAQFLADQATGKPI